MPSPEETPRSRRITQGAKYLPAQTACETRERGVERVGERRGPARRRRPRARAPRRPRRRSARARAGSRAGGRGPTGGGRRRPGAPRGRRGTRRAWPRGRGRPGSGCAAARGALGDRVDRHRVGQREREHVRARPRAASRSSWSSSLDHRPHAAVAPQHVVEPGEHAREVGLQRERGLELLLAHLRARACRGRPGSRSSRSGSSCASRSASRSAQPRNVPSGFRSISPSVVLSPRATKRRYVMP